jgi:hypothetical protein
MPSLLGGSNCREAARGYWVRGSRSPRSPCCSDGAYSEVVAFVLPSSESSEAASFVSRSSESSEAASFVSRSSASPEAAFLSSPAPVPKVLASRGTCLVPKNSRRIATMTSSSTPPSASKRPSFHTCFTRLTSSPPLAPGLLGRLPQTRKTTSPSAPVTWSERARLKEGSPLY